MIVAAINVVRSRNVVHAALSLVAVMAGAAAQYLLLAAEFVAVTQVLVYIGAVMVLFLFGVMLTRARVGREADLNNKNWAVGIPVALLMLGVMVYVLIDGFGDDQLPPDCPGVHRRAQRQHLRAVPAAVLGAVVRAARRRHRRHRPGPEGLTMLLNEFLLLGAVLFCIGVYGVIARKNAVMVLMSIELILNSVNINLLAFSLLHNNLDGNVFALFIIAVAAAEVGVGLAMVLLVYRNRKSISLDELSEMKG